MEGQPNSQLGMLPLLVGLIAWYHNTSTAAWIYLAMHGTSSLVWLIKDFAFPDPNFHKRITIGLFSVNMALKEASMSRYPEWEQYKKRSWLLLPPFL